MGRGLEAWMVNGSDVREGTGCKHSLTIYNGKDWGIDGEVMMPDEQCEQIDEYGDHHGQKFMNIERKSESVMKHAGYWNVFMFLTFVLEFLVLIFVAVLEYFLRLTDIFPLRRQRFDCTDVTLTCSKTDVDLMAEFAFKAQVPDEAVYALSFCVPPFIILIGELGSTFFSYEPQNSVRLLNQRCPVPLVVRRLLRFIGIFLFGAISSMIFVDIIKIVVGQLSPNFLEQCQVNMTRCSNARRSGDEVCVNLDKMALREARTSFPSLNASLTAYSAMFISIYVHGAMSTHTVRILRPFMSLTFLMLSLLCGLSEYVVCRSHCVDVASGFFIGLIFALYIVYDNEFLTKCMCGPLFQGAVVLNQFQEQLSRRHIMHIINSQLANSNIHSEHQCQFSDLPSLYIPRAHMVQKVHRSAHNTFQGDMSHTIENVRRSSYLAGTSSHM